MVQVLHTCKPTGHFIILTLILVLDVVQATAYPFLPLPQMSHHLNPLSPSFTNNRNRYRLFSLWKKVQR